MSQSAVQSPSESSPVGQHRLGLWDTVSLIVGIVVGVAIFKTPPDVFRLAGSPQQGLLIWSLGAVLAFSGALSYAELAAAWPRFGGEYVYLSQAYGRLVGFLFAWLQISIILTSSIGAMAFVFAAYAAHFPKIANVGPGALAALAICLLTAVQLRGFGLGRRAQNLLTLVKVVSLTWLLGCGLLLPALPDAFQTQTATHPSGAEWGLALVLVLYAYGGWNDAATLTPEVNNSRKTMPWALCLALSFIAVLYLALNVSYLRALGFAGLSESTAPAADVIAATLGSGYSRIMSVMVMVSALGAIHGMLFAGCRLLAAVGEDYRWFSHWNRWNARQVPTVALISISAIALVLTLLVGTEVGQQASETVLHRVGLPAPDWERYGGGFEMLVAASAPVFWTFFCLTGLSVVVLRVRQPDVPRPFRTPGYPFTPIVFSASAGYMLWSSLAYAGKLTILLVPVLVLGLVIACFQPTHHPQPTSSR